MKCKIVKWYLVLLLVALACVPLVSAATIDISPHQASPGDLITVTTTGLKDGSDVTMKLVATVNNPGTTYKMEVSNLDFPINLDDASFTITNQNTVSNSVYIVNYIPTIGYTYITTGGKSVNNVWSGYISGEGRDDINGTFDLIRVSGTTTPGASKIISIMQWNGIKRASEDNIPPGQVNGGPEDFAFTFSQNGINSGSIEILILEDGMEVSSDTVIIGNPASTPLPMSSSRFTRFILPGFAERNPYGVSSSIQKQGQKFSPIVVTDSAKGSGSVNSRFRIK
jgi:hypothetical protein